MECWGWKPDWKMSRRKLEEIKLMKNTLLCLLVCLSWGMIFVDSLALPNDDVKEAPKEVAAPQPEKDRDLTPENNRHNVDLSKVTISGDEKVETVEKTDTVWDSRQLIFNDYVSLKWIEWTGSIPSGAVSIINQQSKRTDYVCSVQGCATGYYSPSTGTYCFYSQSGKEYRTSSFKILVNENNFELIEWQAGSYGSVPTDSIGRCPGIYVGKNQYGLGKVVPSAKVLFLPFGGYEYTYDYYEVLRLYANYHTQTINNVGYYTNQVSYNSETLQVLASSKAINNVCQRMKKVVTLSKTTVQDQNWDIRRPTNRGVATMLTTQVPSFSGNTITLLRPEEFEWREGRSRSQTQTHTRTLEITVDPNHECEVVLQGRVIYSSMPFRAQLTRIYQNGEERTTPIQGMFYNRQTDEVSVGVKQCRRIPNSAPCLNS
ncbi:natterin-3-like [Discoglossus pictus]